MKKILKWIAILFGVLAGIVVLAGSAVFLVTNSRINKTYAVPLEEIAVPAGSEAIAKGEHIATIRTGISPSGRALDPAMPAAQFASMTDDELKAVFLFLQSLPPKEQGQ